MNQRTLQSHIRSIRTCIICRDLSPLESWNKPIWSVNFAALGSPKLKAEELIAKLEETFPAAEIRAQDLTGGGDHWRVRIVAEEFRGLNMVEQHQMVYRALGEWMHGPIHALSLDTSSP